MEHTIKYITKCWQDNWQEVLTRHVKADLVLGNNMNEQARREASKYPNFVYIGEAPDPYYNPERWAVDAAKSSDYILWYSGDVIPPKTDWVTEAVKLLRDYPIVSPFWHPDFESYSEWADNKNTPLERTDFGFITQMFTDQAYIAESSTMLGIDYETSHEIAKFYPSHGGNSFERRIAQWLANTNQYVAVLKDHVYEHIPH